MQTNRIIARRRFRCQIPRTSSRTSFPLPQLRALQLAGLGARQRLEVFDGARVLVRRDRLLDEVPLSAISVYNWRDNEGAQVRVQSFLVKGEGMMKAIAVLSLLTAVLGGCAIVPLGYGRHDGYYRGQSYYRGDGYYRGDIYYRGGGHYRERYYPGDDYRERYYPGDGDRGYSYRDRGG